MGELQPLCMLRVSIIWHIPMPAQYSARDNFSFLMTVGWIEPILQPRELFPGPVMGTECLSEDRDQSTAQWFSTFLICGPLTNSLEEVESPVKISTCGLLQSIYELGFHRYLLQTISKFFAGPRLKPPLKKTSFIFHLVLPLQNLVVHLNKILS